MATTLKIIDNAYLQLPRFQELFEFMSHYNQHLTSVKFDMHSVDDDEDDDGPDIELVYKDPGFSPRHMMFNLDRNMAMKIGHLFNQVRS